MMRSLWLMLLVTLGGFALAGCNRPAEPTETGEPAAALRRQIERGPVSIEVTADPGELTAGEVCTLTIDVLAETGVDIEAPTVEDQLGPFEVLQRQTPPDVPDEQGRRWRFEYRLSTFDAGELEIPALTVVTVDRRAADTIPVEGQIIIDPIVLTVRSNLGGDLDAAALAELEPKDIKDFEVIPWSRWAWWTLAGLAGGAVLLVALLWLWWRHRRARIRTAPPEPVLPPHVWASGELKRLAERGLVEKGQLHEYFFALSGVVRGYIERRFGIHAPEQTTEEFIREMERHPVLSVGHRELLSGFLRAADMVKFARHEPPEEQCHRAMQTARDFIEQTAAPADTAPSRPEMAA